MPAAAALCMNFLRFSGLESQPMVQDLLPHVSDCCRIRPMPPHSISLEKIMKPKAKQARLIGHGDCAILKAIENSLEGFLQEGTASCLCFIGSRL